MAQQQAEAERMQRERMQRWVEQKRVEEEEKKRAAEQVRRDEEEKQRLKLAAAERERNRRAQDAAEEKQVLRMLLVDGTPAIDLCEQVALPDGLPTQRILAQKELQEWMTRGKSLIAQAPSDVPGEIRALRDVAPMAKAEAVKPIPELSEAQTGCWMRSISPLLPAVREEAKRELAAQRRYRAPDGFQDTRWGMTVREVRRHDRLRKLNSNAWTGRSFKVFTMSLTPVYRFHRGQLVTVDVAVQGPLLTSPLSDFVTLRDALLEKYTFVEEGLQGGDGRITRLEEAGLLAPGWEGVTLATLDPTTDAVLMVQSDETHVTLRASSRTRSNTSAYAVRGAARSNDSASTAWGRRPWRR